MRGNKFTLQLIIQANFVARKCSLFAFQSAGGAALLASRFSALGGWRYESAGGRRPFALWPARRTCRGPPLGPKVRLQSRPPTTKAKQRRTTLAPPPKSGGQQTARRRRTTNRFHSIHLAARFDCTSGAQIHLQDWRGPQNKLSGCSLNFS